MKRTSVRVFALFSRGGSMMHRVGFPGFVAALVLSSLQLASSAAFAQQRGFVNPTPAAGRTENGSYYALIIGINDYPKGMNKLRTAVGDARAVGKVLEDAYGFKVTYLTDKDATRSNILTAINKFRGTLTPNDNLLIYYAGHGHSDKAADKVYWLPVDADSADSPNRIIADEITSQIKALPARHVLVISDSCYAGGLSRDVSGPPPDRSANYLPKELGKRSRSLMASGGDEPVSDAGANGHSVFANAVLLGLEEEASSKATMFDAQDLFSENVRKQVAGNSDQIPLYAPIRNSGDDGGDFVFVRKGARVSAIASTSSDSRGVTRSADAAAETAAAEPPPPEPAPAPVADIPHSNMTPAPSGSASAKDAFDRGLAALKGGQFGEAFQLLTQACNGGVARGCGNLGTMYQGGNGVKQDLGQAAELYRKACSGDGWGACFFLGLMYESGNGVPKNQAQALPLYQRACEGGDGRGCTNLGIAYETGNGVAQNQALAGSLFRKACETGVPRGCSLLAVAYHEAAGVQKDDSQATALARKACDGGDPMGCNVLGIGYEHGFGVPMNKQQATALFRQACSAGFDAACKNLNRMR